MAGPDSERYYVIDSSSWISVEEHPARTLILYCIIQLIERGRICCPPEVWKELKKCDWVLAWLKDYRKKIVRSISATPYLALVGQVALAYPSMCATRGSKEKGDGYVVAMVVHGNRTTNPQCWVGVAADEKIRIACTEYQAEGIELLDMLRREFPNEKWP